MNLDLPLDEADPAALDACLAEIDRALDELFAGAVAGELVLGHERRERADDPATGTNHLHLG